MNQQKFRNFDLLTISYPFTAIISILHRISGVFLFLLIPFLLWMLETATNSPDGFTYIYAVLANPVAKLILWCMLVAFWYHLLAGIRHLLMDIGIGEGLKSARFTGGVTIALTLIVAIFIGGWLW
ncbi:succinate dehydrogenase, cytochrome b556 subunit [Legionella longbeachae]|uniref:Succinate dehydrogenase cytochrome b556 subunit n=1 Tax=Legionella longbeachae serogroup 1 (strain NSW150) TaxID=661367 RepID=D3HQ35_LEGLN|nr:succinate dehydrogenase, cytochrome b556 subunit [Legionella longbeachae]VEE01519.1 succinate dehydrogenase, cytochrome b556 subunit [Legionella oakridgensis]HBD7396281.1 succinate dehydrogenase, cytochrome b556 subunit [Legionella pneumophila]ARB92127.1 succinate dehydrogenase, cytochrome b556 subunit [Legionella longbeachae]ARM34694.1 succinate dehydrogenase, cytochrome b556 subunit [Legionella longbeachae]EEZ95897.1 succinate dehydrogenase, cytochrome b556 subunit [Legionella longbeachae